MSETDVAEFSPEDFFQIAAILQDVEVFIVGGQALNIWAEVYYHRAPEELSQFSPFTSKDVDYHGLRAAAEYLAERLDGSVYLPSIDEATPNTAIVTLKLNGRSVSIDFVNSVLGVDEETLCKNVIEIELPSIHPEHGDYVRLRLMHPLSVLQSRAANVVTLGRQDDTALRQAGAAVVVLREHILQELEQGYQKAAKSAVKGLIRWLRGSPEAFRLREEVGIDPIETFRGVVSSEFWDFRYKQRLLEPTLKKLEQRYRDKTLERHRKLRGDS